MKATYTGRQVIETKYLGPTNFKGARIRVKADAGKAVTVPWDYALNPADNHACACLRFQSVLGWDDERVGSSLANGTFVWVCK